MVPLRPGIPAAFRATEIFTNSIANLRNRRFSGGSLDMYRDFFRNQELEIVGVDIDPECRSFAQPGVTIEIGDQEDRTFWDGFVSRHAPFDIIIDDGGHTVQQQVATIECLFNHVNPGGLYIVEDILGVTNKFLGYVAGIVAAYNISGINERGTVSPTSLQRMVARIEAVPGAFLFVRHIGGKGSAELHAPWRGNFWTRAARQVFEDHNPGQAPPLT
jgi:2-polyprenyl-3-methyl-5-hydroxy-6-metoxy-1,4-benzoquinol methylase